MTRQTFTWYPDADEDHSVKPSVEVIKFGDGYEVRVPHGINSQSMVWGLIFTRAKTEGLAILNFLRARNGHEAFDWTNPLQEAGVYVCREWKVKHLKGGNLQVSCSFEQVFEA